MLPCKNAAEEVSFEWSHHRISSTDSKVRTTLHAFIIDSESERDKTQVPFKVPTLPWFGGWLRYRLLRFGSDNDVSRNRHATEKQAHRKRPVASRLISPERKRNIPNALRLQFVVSLVTVIALFIISMSKSCKTQPYAYKMYHNDSPSSMSVSYSLKNHRLAISSNKHDKVFFIM